MKFEKFQAARRERIEREEAIRSVEKHQSKERESQSNSAFGNAGIGQSSGDLHVAEMSDLRDQLLNLQISAIDTNTFGSGPVQVS